LLKYNGKELVLLTA